MFRPDPDPNLSKYPDPKHCKILCEVVTNLIEAELELFVDVGAMCSHGGQTQAQAASVLDLLTRGLLHLAWETRNK